MLVDRNVTEYLHRPRIETRIVSITFQVLDAVSLVDLSNDAIRSEP